MTRPYDPVRRRARNLKPKRTHAELKRAVMTAVNRLPGVFVFPTGVGSFRIGARFIRLGMVGTPDLVGWQRWPQVITDVRHPLKSSLAVPMPYFPRFIALEIKVGPDRLRPEQRAFLDKVRAVGGIAVEVRSVEDAVQALL